MLPNAEQYREQVRADRKWSLALSDGSTGFVPVIQKHSLACRREECDCLQVSLRAPAQRPGDQPSFGTVGNGGGQRREQSTGQVFILFRNSSSSRTPGLV